MHVRAENLKGVLPAGRAFLDVPDDFPERNRLRQRGVRGAIRMRMMMFMRKNGVKYVVPAVAAREKMRFYILRKVQRLRDLLKRKRRLCRAKNGKRDRKAEARGKREGKGRACKKTAGDARAHAGIFRDKAPA